MTRVTSGRSGGRPAPLPPSTSPGISIVFLLAGGHEGAAEEEEEDAHPRGGLVRVPGDADPGPRTGTGTGPADLSRPSGGADVVQESLLPTLRRRRARLQVRRRLRRSRRLLPRLPRPLQSPRRTVGVHPSALRRDQAADEQVPLFRRLRGQFRLLQQLRARVPGFRRQPLLLVSLDGLRADYLHLWKGLIPVLTKLKKCGTSSSYMQAAFPSKTFPNHYSIVTGLYPESNGLIDNVMYDPVMDAIFTLSGPEKENPDWYLGQPIWNTAMYQGLKSGTFFWPGSDVKINGSFPDIHRPYDGKIPFEERILTVLKWLQLPDQQRPDFYTLYLEEPDKSGHSFGPVSGGVAQAVKAVDKMMGQLMNGLKQIGLHRCVNVIVVADHGMEETSCDRKENLEEFLGDVSNLAVTDGPFGRIRARNSNTQLDSAGLVANMTCKRATQKLRPYLKWHLPKRLHYANSRRIEDVTILVEPKWLLERLPGSLRFCSGGQHGYDNDAESMHAMFVAHGPKFVARAEVEPFANIELYNLMCDVLQISPAANNGTHGSLNHLLRQPFYSPLRPEEQSAPAECRLVSLEPPNLLGCSCPHMSADAVTAANRRLNMTSGQEAAARRNHLPFGRPRSLRRGERYCLLHQEAFVSAYSKDQKMALWSSFSVAAPNKSEPSAPVRPDCLRADVRIPPADSRPCDEYGDFRRGFLYPPGLSPDEEERGDALLSSHVVPMYPRFHKDKEYVQFFHLRDVGLLPRHAAQEVRVRLQRGQRAERARLRPRPRRAPRPAGAHRAAGVPRQRVRPHPLLRGADQLPKRQPIAGRVRRTVARRGFPAASQSGRRRELPGMEANRDRRPRR
ncbi:ectonucleotide pyrophosphatase/phosphodiesterase family member 3 isoform X3 [Syngnathoides biaculeatus]|uniref:ectonucleotide pyrophosphatase/phosphodiesterase family member 3 isoform X3 n=1 Tax=Syngnathoides biaculeatus TaxID=300417 RepID=UPI002ADD6809|nr:ectonucleotide pyrophosphatase/phosphodiesterase family member 3 isoform X3 [Syngnathoides biaculeatus]